MTDGEAPPPVDRIRYRLHEGERERMDRIMCRNAVLFDLFGANRRDAYDAMAGQTLLADTVTAEPVSTAGVSGWWLRPAGAVPGRAILFVHGGGYHLGSARGYLGFVSQIAAAARCAIFSADYRLAPEHRFPAALDDIVDAFRWLAGQGFDEIAAAGDSAGGGLVLAALNCLPAEARIASATVFSPWTDLANSGASFSDPTTPDPVFKPDLLRGLANSYLGDISPFDPGASPLYGIGGAGPPLLIQVGGDELLLDDSIRYADRAARQGRRVRLEIHEGMYHVFQRDFGVLPTAREAVSRAASFIDASWQGRRSCG